MGASDKKELERIVKVLEDQTVNPGWRVVRSTGKHQRRAFPADKAFKPISIPDTPSDYRGMLNLRAQLRRAGARGL